MFRLFRSAAFRLTLLYMVMFGASVTALLIFIYTTIIGDMQEDLKQAISIQLADLERKFIMSGVGETGASMEHMLEKDDEKTLVLMLIDRDWHVIAGNIDRWPGGKTSMSTWITFPIGKGTSTSPAPKAIAMNSTLPGGYILLVGRKMIHIEHVRDLMVEAFYICLGIMLVIAAAGGMLLSFTIYQRIDTINQTFRSVAAGDLATRVKLSGTGDEFDHLAMHLNRTLARVGELVEGVRDISYSVAHDLRTPLHRLRHRIESLVAGEVNREQTVEQLRIALYEIDSLVATFNAILNIAQAEARAGVEQFDRFDLSEAVEDVVYLYQGVAEEKAQMLTAMIEPQITMLGNRHLVAQAVANLLDNAIKYTPKSGTITLQLQTIGRHISLRIADSGIGIAPEFHRKITQKFFRMEESRSTPGNGLGLSLVEAVVKLHQGDLTFADNHPGLIVSLTFAL